jgi:hypothetical protein
MSGRGEEEPLAKRVAGLLGSKSCQCTICLVEVEEDERVRGAACAPGHEMHFECLRAWAEVGEERTGGWENNDDAVGKCPVCRSPLNDLAFFSHSNKSVMLTSPPEMKEAIACVCRLRLRIKSFPAQVLVPWKLALTENERLVAACYADESTKEEAATVAHQSLLQGAKVNFRDSCLGATPLGVALYLGNRPMIQLLTNWDAAQEEEKKMDLKRMMRTSSSEGIGYLFPLIEVCLGHSEGHFEEDPAEVIDSLFSTFGVKRFNVNMQTSVSKETFLHALIGWHCRRSSMASLKKVLTTVGSTFDKRLCDSKMRTVYERARDMHYPEEILTLLRPLESFQGWATPGPFIPDDEWPPISSPPYRPSSPLWSPPPPTYQPNLGGIVVGPAEEAPAAPVALSAVGNLPLGLRVEVLATQRRGFLLESSLGAPSVWVALDGEEGGHQFHLDQLTRVLPDQENDMVVVLDDGPRVASFGQVRAIGGENCLIRFRGNGYDAAIVRKNRLGKVSPDYYPPDGGPEYT